MSKEIITEVEIKSGFVARNKKLLPKTTDVDEFMEYVIPRIDTAEFIGVNYKDRVEWLEANGYELTRANLINPNLSTKQPE